MIVQLNEHFNLGRLISNRFIHSQKHENTQKLKAIDCVLAIELESCSFSGKSVGNSEIYKGNQLIQVGNTDQLFDKYAMGFVKFF